MLLFHWFQSLYWPESGKGYALGSSWAGDTGTLSIFGLFWITWRRHNCHQHGCPRVGRHEVTADGQKQLFCHKHKPSLGDSPK